MTETKPLKTLAEEWGVNRNTLAEIVKLHGIPTVRVPYCGLGKGLDHAGQKLARKHLGLDKSTPAKIA